MNSVAKNMGLLARHSEYKIVRINRWIWGFLLFLKILKKNGLKESIISPIIQL